VAAAQAPPPPPPPGLSSADAAAFEEKGPPDAWELVRRKLGALQLIAGATAGSPVLSAGAGAQEAQTAGRDGDAGSGDQRPGAGPQLLTPSEVLIPLLAAASDPSEPVSRWAGRRLCNTVGCLCFLSHACQRLKLALNPVIQPPPAPDPQGAVRRWCGASAAWRVRGRLSSWRTRSWRGG
jgi:hypothetical protein